MILYILKTIGCALFFIVMFHYLLENDKVLKFKRFYLLTALLFSFIIPFVSIPSISDHFSPILEKTDVYTNIAKAGYFPLPLSAQDVTTSPVLNEQPIRTTYTGLHIVIGLYILVTSILLVRFIYNLAMLLKMISYTPVLRQGNIRIIIKDGLNASFSFFNYIFVNKNDYQNQLVKNEILIHEMTHVKQIHSADVLFVELLIVFFWFNPALYLYRRAMKLNHEFLADEGVINNTEDIPFYQMLLVERATHPYNYSLTSSLTYSITKKRLIMMTKTTSQSNFFFKMTLLIPAFLLAGGFFSARLMAESKVDKSVGKQMEMPLSPPTEEIMIVPESGVSQEKIDEYTSIVSKYLDKIVDEKVSWKPTKITREDELTLYPIYIQMTNEQRKKQLVHFTSPLTPFKLRSPNVDEWRWCTNGKSGQIWLDGKLIDTKEANTHNRKEIVFFVRRNDIPNSYLWTQKGYDEFLKKYGKQISLDDLLKMPAYYMVTTGFGKKMAR